MNMHVKAESKFKVGQRVNWTRVRGEFDGSTIEAIGTGAWPVTIRAKNGNHTYADFHELELAPKFSVGDKVRALESCYGGGYKKGNVYTVKSVSDEYDHITTELDDKGSRTNGWRASAFEPSPTYASCAAAEVDNLADEYGGGRKAMVRKPGYRFTNIDRPNPGDRVSIGEQGTFAVKDVTADGYIHFADRPRDTTWQLHDTQSSSACTLVQAATALRIEAGKFYKTRDGRKVGPMVSSARRGIDRQYPFTVDHEFSTAFAEGWREDGTFSPFPEPDDGDLIAEWQDEPAAKFKVGDKIGCTTNKATNYVVKKVSGDKVDVAALRLDGREETYTFSNQDANIFFLLPAATTIADIVRKHAIVALIENGQPKPSTVPYVHADRANATTEAGRLAGIHKGSKFGVYELVDIQKVEKVYDHEWQRLAANGKKLGAIKELRGMTGLGLATAKDAVEDWLRRAA
ncbi:hypothetical protein [Mesorhizobium sp.]|uniref:hypothetical protein n=1 Tax=Mesorhizobium sp. TaxID=1871066 RepID=UPI000FE834C2|nr:hypothetical protein [Mesorhizobium sp.]RWO20703.1 MAG: hypothetical protein EOS09_26665 [Mesorhizobium sp.]